MDDFVTHQELRSIVHAQGLWHRGVHVLLFTEEGYLLIQKRSADRKQYASLWDCSVSEHVQSGEVYLEAARRGLEEELGVRGIALRPIFKFRMNYGPNDNEISMVFEGSVDSARVRRDPREVSEVAYIRPDELSARMSQSSHEFCGWFFQIMKWLTGQPAELEPLEVTGNSHIVPRTFPLA